MALTDPYVSAEEYNIRSNRTRSSGDEDTAALEEELTATSRLLEGEMGVSLGGWHEVAGTRSFDGLGEERLYLRDAAGMAYFLQSIDADSLKIDTNLDGTFEYALDLDDAWVRGIPENAAEIGRAFTAIELLPMTTATVTKFPKLRGSVQITGIWGVPAAQLAMVKEVVVSMTRDLRDHHALGAQNNYQRLDDGDVRLTDQTWRLIRAMKAQLDRRIPSFA